MSVYKESEGKKGGLSQTFTKRDKKAKRKLTSSLYYIIGGDSGEHTFVEEWKEHNIAYHVSTLIPSRQGDKQQVQKKRHIGNGKENIYIYIYIMKKRKKGSEENYMYG